jgi:anti-sigma regulatory factor (Ser/Thr protein kinase)
MTGLAPAEGYEDDVALLLYRQPAPLEVDVRADTEHLAPARDVVRQWLDRCDLDSGQAQHLLFAAGEAVANAIEHGHRDTPGGQIRIRAIATADEVRLTVTDTGSWKPPRATASARGRGLVLMRAVMHDVTVHSDADGTTVHLNARID